MAETKKKYKGGPARKSYLQNMAGQGQRSIGTYSKYGDIDPSIVHEGDATYRGVTLTDHPSTVRSRYSVNVKRGHGKTVFRLQGKLYQITNFSGSTSEEIQI